MEDSDSKAAGICTEGMGVCVCGGVGGGERASQRGETGRGTGWAGGVGSGTLLQFHSGMMEILSGAKPRVEGVW
jgi:hypothetical protein